MKIAVLNEFSQAPKNNIIVNELKKVVPDSIDYPGRVIF